MIDCPDHGPVDGLFCLRCKPKAPRNPPLDPRVKAKIDKILGRYPKPIDRELEAERAAIRDEGW